MIKLTFEKENKFVSNSNSICIMQCKIALDKVPISYEELIKIADKTNIELIGRTFRFMVTAVTRCHVEDAEKYDETLGLRIAESKCKIKAYNKAHRIVSTLTERISLVHDVVALDDVKLRSLENYERAHLNKLTA